MRIKRGEEIRNLERTIYFQRFFLVFFFFVLLSGFFYFILIDKLFFPYEDYSCGDGTLNFECSNLEPFYCERGVLVEKASFCGCPDSQKVLYDVCLTPYKFDSRTIELSYVLRGEEGKIPFTLYSGLINYISNLSKFGSNQSREYFKERNIHDAEQRKLLLPLVKKIQNIATNPDDQARIAISIVQNIPYGESFKTVSFFGADTGVRYSRYPYEVLYDHQGVCGEKSELLGFLLEELGFGYIFYYYPGENHEAFGIRCPNKYSREGDGYCFVETTGPSIITNDENNYANIGGPLLSEPEVIYEHSGNLFGWEDLYEYDDARSFIHYNELISSKGGLNFFRKYSRDFLVEKYGL